MYLHADRQTYAHTDTHIRSDILYGHSFPHTFPHAFEVGGNGKFINSLALKRWKSGWECTIYSCGDSPDLVSETALLSPSAIL